MNILKKAQTALAGLLSVAMIASMGALALWAEEAAPTGTKIEAEDATLNGTAAIVTEAQVTDGTFGADVSGGAFVGSLGAEGGSATNYVEITVTSEFAGERNIDIAYITRGTRSIDVVVNDHEAVNVSTPGNNSNWNGNVLTVTASVWMDAGENVVRFCNLSGWAPNIDYVVVHDSNADEMENAVANLIAEAEALPEEIGSVDDLPKYENVVAKYTSLTDAQKALLTADQKATLDAVKATLDAYNAAVEQAAIDRSAAATVTGLINVINSAADKSVAVRAAREAYDALTDTQKQYISAGTLKLLTDAEAALEAGGDTSGDNNNTANNGADNNANNNADNSDKTDDSSDYTVIIVIVVVVVVVVAGAVVLVVVRKKK